MSTEGAHRLPRTVVPEHYQLTFNVALAAGTFAGEERVRVAVLEPTDEIVLNAVDLQIADAELIEADGTTVPATVELVPGDERAVVRLAATAAPGPATLHLAFSGVLGDKLHGVYRSTYVDDGGVTRTIAATQFEPTDARRAFPCWDEPDRKATFATTLVVDEGLTAVSNSEVVEVTALGEGRVQYEFATTMRMSTYLVAFVVGPLVATEPVDVDGAALRIVCVPGKTHLTGFGLDIGASALRFFASYFGVPYPAAKLDLIALPDFAMGAMENLGAVTFRETLLLVDPERATRGELERVADVVAHEIAHMWFGDLVTMRWWNGIWLNEAFATFMELLCVDDFRPEWQRWVSFGTTRDAAMVVDALPSTRPVEFPVERPEEAEGMFDTLTYQKGAGVLRMLERYVGADQFRLGISRYIADHAYDNTETSDLWDAVEKATGEPARSIMDSWILQGGFPQVTAALAPGGAGLDLSQRPFRYLDDGRAGGGPTWRIPVHVRASVGGEVVRRRLLLDADGAHVDLGGAPEWAVVNEHGWGFYRVRYDDALRRRLESHLDGLGPLERLCLVSDTWAAVLAADAGAEELLELAERLAGDDDPSVWEAVLDALGELDRVVPSADRAELQSFVRRLAGPALARLAWSPGEGEDERRSRLRAALIRTLGVLGADPEVRARAAEVHARAVSDPSSVDADVAGAVVAVVAAGGGRDEYEAFLAHHRSAATPQDEVRYLYALAGFEDAELVARTLELAFSEVRPQNAPFVLSLLLANRAGGAGVWAVVKRRWDELRRRLPENLHERALGGTTALSTPELAADVRAFLEANPLPGRERTVAQILEKLDVAVALRAREGPRLGGWLRTRPSPPPAG
ncbi:MAG TPA: M1 family aminopeptidase [Acidimicrobiales bacterium]|nr:M1 family aminopeptidase [Acidimicrobiales bacterium]